MREYVTDDIIYALATPWAQSALAVIRVSGEGCRTLLATRFSRPKALKEECFRIRHQFNRYSSIGKRWMMNKQNLKNSVIYLGTNLVNRREILRKQGREL